MYLSIWLFICILYNTLYNKQAYIFSLSFMGHSSKLIETRKEVVETLIYSWSVRSIDNNLLLATGIWSEGSLVGLSKKHVGPNTHLYLDIVSELKWITEQLVSPGEILDVLVKKQQQQNIHLDTEVFCEGLCRSRGGKSDLFPTVR